MNTVRPIAIRSGQTLSYVPGIELEFLCLSGQEDLQADLLKSGLKSPQTSHAPKARLH